MAGRDNDRILAGLAVGAAAALGTIFAMQYFDGSKEKETEVAHTSGSWGSLAKKEETKIAYSSGSGRVLGDKRIQIIETVEGCQNAVSTLKQHCRDYQVLGFDCEWIRIGATRHQVALLQLASQNGFCALFRLCLFPKIPQSLIDLLEDANIIKVGVDCQLDASHLCHDFGINVASTLDLRFLATEAQYEPASLARMAKSVLNVNLNKDLNIVVSDWEAYKLTAEQIDYAANDAYVAIKIFDKFFNKIKPQGFLSNFLYPLDILNGEFRHLYGKPYKFTLR